MLETMIHESKVIENHVMNDTQHTSNTVSTQRHVICTNQTVKPYEKKRNFKLLRRNTTNQTDWIEVDSVYN